MNVPKRKCIINSLKVMEVTIKSGSYSNDIMDAVYALGQGVEGEGGRKLTSTHGRCTANTNNWSEDTMKLLSELLNAMEEDLLPRHFEKTAGTEDTDAGIKSRTDEDGHQI